MRTPSGGRFPSRSDSGTKSARDRERLRDAQPLHEAVGDRSERILLGQGGKLGGEVRERPLDLRIGFDIVRDDAAREHDQHRDAANTRSMTAVSVAKPPASSSSLSAISRPNT